MKKNYINDRRAFIEWKEKYTTYNGKFHAISCNEDEPTSYPCILLEYEEQKYNNTYLDFNTYYSFVYLTDFSYINNDMKYCDLIKIAIESHMATYQRLLKSPQLGLFERKEYNNVVNACKNCLSIIQDTLNKTPDELNYFIEQHKKNIEYDY